MDIELSWMLDENNNPVSTKDRGEYRQWRNSERGRAQRIVGRDEVGPYHIATSFILIDHGFGAGGPPVLWETLIQGPDGYEYSEWIDRYTSHAAALQGHNRMVALLREHYPPEPEPAPVDHIPGRGKRLIDTDD